MNRAAHVSKRVLVSSARTRGTCSDLKNPLPDGRGSDFAPRALLGGRGSGYAPSAQTRAFTLLEVLIVISILTLLIAILLPSLTGAREQAKRLACLSNQRQIAVAMQTYAMDFADTFPIAQYIDMAGGAFVAWDTRTPFSDPDHATPGLIWEYADGGAVQQCPSYDGPSLTSGDVYTGFNYNTTYIGRGQGESDFLSMTEAPARTTQIRSASRAALVGDGGWSAGANKFMRAPLDGGVSEQTAHAGAQALRHAKSTNVVHVDGHGATQSALFTKPDAAPQSLDLLGWPANGFLSADDSAYTRF